MTFQGNISLFHYNSLVLNFIQIQKGQFVIVSYYYGSANYTPTYYSNDNNNKAKTEKGQGHAMI